MSYKIRTVKCPKCGKRSDTNVFYIKDELYGTPFRQCPKCKASYFDPAYRELGIAIYEDKGTNFRFGTIVWTILFNICAVFCLYELTKTSQDEFIIGILCVALFSVIAVLLDIRLIISIKNYNQKDRYHQKQIDYLEGRGKKLSGEELESIERLSHLDYLSALKAYGVNVPDYFYERLGIRNVSFSSETSSSPKEHEQKPSEKEEKSKMYIVFVVLVIVAFAISTVYTIINHQSAEEGELQSQSQEFDPIVEYQTSQEEKDLLESQQEKDEIEYQIQQAEREYAAQLAAQRQREALIAAQKAAQEATDAQP